MPRATIENFESITAGTAVTSSSTWVNESGAAITPTVESYGGSNQILISDTIGADQVLCTKTLPRPVRIQEAVTFDVTIPTFHADDSVRWIDIKFRETSTTIIKLRIYLNDGSIYSYNGSSWVDTGLDVVVATATTITVRITAGQTHTVAVGASTSSSLVSCATITRYLSKVEIDSSNENKSDTTDTLESDPTTPTSLSDNFQLMNWVNGVQGFHVTKSNWIDMTGWTLNGSTNEVDGWRVMQHSADPVGDFMIYITPSVTKTMEVSFKWYVPVPAVLSLGATWKMVVQTAGGASIGNFYVMWLNATEAKFYINDVHVGTYNPTAITTIDVRMEKTDTAIAWKWRENGTTDWTAFTAVAATGDFGRLTTSVLGGSSYLWGAAIDDLKLGDGDHDEVMDLGETTAYLDITSLLTHVLAIEVYFADAACNFAFADHVRNDFLGAATTKAHYLKISGDGSLTWEYYSDVITGTPNTQVTLDQVLVAGWNTISIDLFNGIVTVNGVEDLVTIEFSDILMVAITGAVSTYFDNLVLQARQSQSALVFGADWEYIEHDDAHSTTHVLRSKGVLVNAAYIYDLVANMNIHDEFGVYIWQKLITNNTSTIYLMRDNVIVTGVYLKYTTSPGPRVYCFDDSILTTFTGDAWTKISFLKTATGINIYINDVNFGALTLNNDVTPNGLKITTNTSNNLVDDIIIRTHLPITAYLDNFVQVINEGFQFTLTNDVNSGTWTTTKPLVKEFIPVARDLSDLTRADEINIQRLMGFKRVIIIMMGNRTPEEVGISRSTEGPGSADSYTIIIKSGSFLDTMDIWTNLREILVTKVDSAVYSRYEIEPAGFAPTPGRVDATMQITAFRSGMARE